MAFPTQGVLDDFNRADGAVGAAWSKILTTLNGLEVFSNAARNESTGNTAGMYWNAGTHADSEVYATLAALANGTFMSLAARVNDLTGTTRDAYELRFDRVSGNNNDTFILRRVDNNTGTQLGTTITQEVAVGDKIGLEIIGSTLTAYRHDGASWASLGNRTDATYASGFIGLLVSANQTPKFDDFGGGTVAAGGTVHPLSLAGAISPTGSLAKRTAKRLTGAVAPAGGLAKAIAVHVAGTVTPSGVVGLARTLRLALAGTITPSGALAKLTGKHTAGTVTPTGALSRKTSKAHAGEITPTGSLARRLAKKLAGTVAPIGSLAVQLITAGGTVWQLTLGGSITPAGTLAKLTRKTLACTIAPAGTMIKRTAKRIAGAVSPAGTLQLLRTIRLTLGGAITPAGTLSKATRKRLAGAIAPVGTLAKKIRKRLGGLIAPLGNLVAQLIGPASQRLRGYGEFQVIRAEGELRVVRAHGNLDAIRASDSEFRI